MKNKTNRSSDTLRSQMNRLKRTRETVNVVFEFNTLRIGYAHREFGQPCTNGELDT